MKGKAEEAGGSKERIGFKEKEREQRNESSSETDLEIGIVGGHAGQPVEPNRRANNKRGGIFVRGEIRNAI